MVQPETPNRTSRTERLEALVTLNNMTDADESELTHFAMEAAVKLTGSSIGYIAFTNDDETVLTMYAWSKQAMAECQVANKPIVYPVASTGLWGEAVRQRRPIITNDYAAPSPLDKGTPAGHVRITRHMNAPTFDSGHIVILAGVGNKPTDYDDDDLAQLSLLMSGLWSIIRRRRAEEALEREHDLYKDLVASQPSGVYRLRIRAQQPWKEPEWVGRVESNYHLEMVSDLFCEILGVTREQCEANAAIVVESIHPDDRPSFTARNVVALETMQPFIWEGRLKRVDKETWAHFASVPRQLDNGDVVWTGILLDITERKRSEVALHLFRESVENSSDAVGMSTPEGRHYYQNKAFDDLFGPVGENPPESVYVDPNVGHEVFRTIMQGKTWTGEVQMYSRDRKVLTVLLRAYASRDQAGRIAALVGLHTDITEQKRLEQERRDLDSRLHQTQRLESLGVLAGGIAHDFNNILMAALGHAELALEELSPVAPGRESVLQIKEAGMRAAELCSQMLAYAGKGRIEKQDFGLSNLVDETLHMLRTCISKKCTLALELCPALPSIHGDVSQVRQVLMNLVINASEAIGDNPGRITVSTRMVQCSQECAQHNHLAKPITPGPYVCLEVADTGCGMSQETVHRMFDPFFTTKFTGRGLGLSAVLGIVQAHGGAISVQSELGHGSTIQVLFPAKATAPPCGKGAHINSGWRGRGTVLLADDEETVRTVSRKLLEYLGLSVLTAEDGLECVDLYKKHGAEIDVVMLDLTMPRMSGDEALRALRQINPRVRVILASGYSESDIASRFAGEGLAGCLQKPYTLASLRCLFAELLKDS